MIYLDTSVALAHLLSEDRRPPDSLWSNTLVTSRLLEYEAWTRLHARDLTSSHGGHLQELLGRFAFLELSAPVLKRVKDPFPVPVRTLDAIHLASLSYLIDQGQEVSLATYDHRMMEASRRSQISVLELP